MSKSKIEWTLWASNKHEMVWPDNAWNGVTVCNQAEADKKIPQHLQVPAKVRFLSIEPMLEPVDIGSALENCGEFYCPNCQKFFDEPGENYLCDCGKEFADPEERDNCPSCGCGDWEYQCPDCGKYGDSGGLSHSSCRQRTISEQLPGLDWVIVGCESGPGRRHTEIRWIEDVVKQCVEANVPVFVKQAEIDGKVVKMPEILGKVWDQMPGGDG